MANPHRGGSTYSEQVKSRSRRPPINLEDEGEDLLGSGTEEQLDRVSAWEECFGRNGSDETPDATSCEEEDIQDQENHQDAKVIPPHIQDILDVRMSEDGVAQLFLTSEGGKGLAYAPAWSSWFNWDGQRWVVDDLGVQRGLLVWLRQHYVPAIEAAAQADLIPAHKAEKWVQHCLSSRGVSAILSLMKSDVVIDVSMFDADANLLNTPSGVINLRTFAVAPHERQLVRRMAGASLGSRCPRWTKFMFEITGGDAQLARYLQVAAGYTLTGSTEAHRAFLLVGPGANGKSVFLATIHHVMGDYATTADKHTIIETKNEQHPAALAALEGARMVVVPELPDGRRLDSDRFKALVGGDEVSARLMRQNPRTFRPKAKLWITTNSLPRVADDSDGMWRRIVPIPFSVSFTGAMIDYDLEAKLKAEAPGILAWMLDGLRIYREEGLIEPACIQAIKTEYRRGEDEVSEFLEELEIENEPTNQLSSSRMFEAYAQWAKRRGYRPITHNNLSRRLKAHGVNPVHTRFGNAYIGWRLRDGVSGPRVVLQDPIDAD